VPEITLILHRIEQGDSQAAEELLVLVYDDLRKLASSKMAREAAGQTLQPTALVYEAWLRLGGDQQPDWQNRAHFFAAAAESMRQILIDRARNHHNKVAMGKEFTRRRLVLPLPLAPGETRTGSFFSHGAESPLARTGLVLRF
jgi:RNA polymerase sigma factor (TIGR02999 family)